MHRNHSQEQIIITGIPREEVEVALGFLGSTGYRIEVVPVVEGLKNEPTLGYVTLEELKSIAAENPVYDSKQTPIRLWNSIGQYCGAAWQSEEFGKVELFIGPDPKKGLWQECLNVDTLHLLTESGRLSEVPNIGKKVVNFAIEFLKQRQEAVMSEAEPET